MELVEIWYTLDLPEQSMAKQWTAEKHANETKQRQ